DCGAHCEQCSQITFSSAAAAPAPNVSSATSRTKRTFSDFQLAVFAAMPELHFPSATLWKLPPSALNSTLYHVIRPPRPVSPGGVYCSPVVSYSFPKSRVIDWGIGSAGFNCDDHRLSGRPSSA